MLACLPWACAGGAHAAELTRVADAIPLPGQADDRLHALIVSHQGQPLIINFWASWCEPCRQEMPSLQRLAGRWRERGLAVITVAVADSRKASETFLSENALQFAVIDDRDQRLSRAWGAHVLPSTVILDRRHHIRLRGHGAIDCIPRRSSAPFHPC